MTETPSSPDLSFLVPMLSMVPEGYFCVRQDTNEPWKFFRMTRKNTKRYRNTTRFQSQHSDELYTRMVILHDVDDKIWVDPWWPNKIHLQTYLLLIISDYQGAMMEYAQHTDHCGRCGKQLTDERSRWYGIGPECEKVLPWWIERVNESDKGEYVEGVSDRDH